MKTRMPSQRVAGSFKPSTVNEKNRTVEVIFTTGQAGKRYDWYNGVEYIEELDVTPESVRTDRLEKGLSVIDNHRTYDGINGVFGITEDYRFDNGSLIGTVRFAEDEDSDKIFNKVKDGILRHVSLGYTVHKFLKSRGETDKLDTYRAVDWSPSELSFTPVSFETENGTRGAEPRDLNVVTIEEKTMTPEQLARLQALTNRSASLTAEEIVEYSNLQTLQSVELNRATPPVPAAPTGMSLTAEQITAAVRAGLPVESTPTPAGEETIVDAVTIRKQERENLDTMLSAAKVAGMKSDFATRQFNEGISVDQFRANLFTEMSKEDSDFVIDNNGVSLKEDGRADEAETKREAAVIAIQQRSGLALDSKVDCKQFRGYSLYEIAREFDNAKGVSIKGASRLALAGRAFHSTSDFPLILENVMHKSLNAAYEQTPQTFTDLGDRNTVTDFRDQNSYSLGDAPELLPLSESGEYKGGSISEAKERYRISTFARKISFTRQALINDDMSALNRLPAAFGQAGANLESNIVWGLLLGWDFFKNVANVVNMSDGLPLFHASHNNIVLGQAFSETALSEMRKLGRSQKTIDGNYMNLTYQTLVLPQSLETSGEKILLGNVSAITSATVNPFTNKLLHRIEPRLEAVSATDYYAFSNILKVFDYAYLAGEEQMMTEVVTQTDVDGLVIKVRKDFGAGLKETRGAAKGSA